ncbi:hypothetical protein [Flavobacterium sp. 140616W15]|uniref:hypothetical protein n=1 Tax=Flavobacterium sp. 140616W15 TaxID=2478552 RepID=UPI000F0CD431|nr:hypothetical protein [Flavobacterium sp. 140616W15]AYN02740.1 hypothetical protein EAG11_00030 [Flavobacterium sp. 140616W15]
MNTILHHILKTTINIHRKPKGKFVIVDAGKFEILKQINLGSSSINGFSIDDQGRVWTSLIEGGIYFRVSCFVEMTILGKNFRKLRLFFYHDPSESKQDKQLHELNLLNLPNLRERK